jgi:hypothetical protein
MRNFPPLPPDCDRRHSKDRLTGYCEGAKPPKAQGLVPYFG